VKAEALPAVLRRLGVRLFPAAPLPEGQLGPPAPATMAPVRRRRTEPDSAPPRPAHRASPFAVLAALRR